MLSVTTETFARDVEQASLQQPVVVDFWGHRCGPCKALAPVLERLAPEYAGRMTLVKVNVQEGTNQELAQRLRFQGIPHLIAFVDGRPIRRLSGNRPEPELRAFFDDVLRAPRGAGTARQSGMLRLEAGDSAGGITALREALALEPANDEIRLALAEALERAPGLLEKEGLTEIGGLLDGCSEETRRGSMRLRYDSLRLRWRCMQEAPSMPPISALRERVATDPDNLQDRMQLVRRCVAERAFEEAAQQLLACMQATSERARSFVEADRELSLVLALSGVGLASQQEQQKPLRKRVYSP